MLKKSSSVIIRGNPHEHANCPTSISRGIDPSALKSAPHALEYETLLRIHRSRLTRGNSKKARVKVIGSIDKPASKDRWVGTPLIDTNAQLIKKKLPLFSYRPNGIPTGSEQIPELVGAVDIRKPATKPHNGNGFSIAVGGGFLEC